MSEARKNILTRLRGANAAKAGIDRKYNVRSWPVDERVRRFRERMEAVRTEVHEAGSHDWTRRLATIAKKKSIDNLLASPDTVWGRQLHADWGELDEAPALLSYERDIEEWKQSLFYDVDASFTTSLGGIAETGSLVLWPTPEEPRLMSLVPPVHFVVLETDKLYTTFAEIVRDQDWSHSLPTNALLISGPSKTADIEQTLAYGIHGPKELVVLLIS